MKYDQANPLSRPSTVQASGKPTAKLGDKSASAPARKVLRRPDATVVRNVSAKPLSGELRSELFALEPRMLFDGAGMIAAVDVANDVNHVKDWAGKTWTDASHDAVATYAANQQPSTLLVIDQSVNNWQSLAQGVGSDVQVLVLDRNSDGLAQIAAAVSNRSNLASIQIVSHGSDGLVTLGNRVIDRQALSSSQAALGTIGQSLSADGDLLLYGCDVARGTNGLAFINDLANATHADVAASNNLTGAAAAGGDWTLEVRVGSVEAINAIAQPALDAFSGILPTTIPAGTGYIRGHLWDDTLTNNRNLDIGGPLDENCFANIQVKLISAGADGIFGTTDDGEKIAMTGNGKNGTEFGVYEFKDIAAGNYMIMVPTTLDDGLSGIVTVCDDPGSLGKTGASVFGGANDGMSLVNVVEGVAVNNQDFGYIQTNQRPEITLNAVSPRTVITGTPFGFTGVDKISIAETHPVGNFAVGQTHTLYAVEVTTTSASGVFNAGAAPGFASGLPTVITGNGTNVITLRGDLTAINMSLMSLTYTNAQRSFAGDRVTVKVTDNTGDINGNCVANEAADTFVESKFTTLYFDATTNTAPTARDDRNAVAADRTTPVTGNAIGVSGRRPTGSTNDAGDSDPEGDVLTICGLKANDALGNPPTGALNDPLTVGAPVLGMYGTLKLEADGSYSYQVNTTNTAVRNLVVGTAIEDKFSYCVADGYGGETRAQIIITINGANVLPIAKPDTNFVLRGTTGPVTGNVIGGPGVSGGDVADMDMNPADVLAVCGVVRGDVASVPSTGVNADVTGMYGTIKIGADGRYSYVLDNTNAAVIALDGTQPLLTDTFTYCLTDGRGGFTRTTVTITISPEIAANPDKLTIAADQGPATGGNVITGARPEMADFIPTNGIANVYGVAAGMPTGPLVTDLTNPVTVMGLHGTLTIDKDGNYTYKLNTSDPAVIAAKPGVVIEDKFSYTVGDKKGARATTTLTICITGINDCPIPAADTNTVAATGGTATNGNVLGGPGKSAGDKADIDPDGDPLRVCGVAVGSVTDAATVTANVGASLMGTYGAITVNADGTYRYIVDASKAGVVALRPGQTLTDTFTYCVTDGTCAPKVTTVVITLTGTNEPPTATGRSEMVAEGGAIVCDLALVADPDNTPAELKITINTISNADSGTFFLREPIAGQPGQFREVPVIAGAMFTGEQLTQLCFRPNPAPNAPRNPDGSLLSPVLTYTVTDPSGSTAQAAVTIMIKPPVKVDPPVVVPPVVVPPVVVPPVVVPPVVVPPVVVPPVVAPPVAVTPVTPVVPVIVPPVIIPPVITGVNPVFPGAPPVTALVPVIPSLVPLLSLEPPLDPVSLFEPYASLAQADPRAPTAVKSAAVALPEKAVKGDADCVPAVKAKIKPKAVKRSVFAEAVAKPSAAFSEQLKDAKKRFKPPVKLIPKQALVKDC